MSFLIILLAELQGDVKDFVDSCRVYQQMKFSTQALLVAAIADTNKSVGQDYNGLYYWTGVI